MKKIICLFVLTLLIITSVVTYITDYNEIENNYFSFSVMNYNIRTAIIDDGNNSWENRRGYLCDQIDDSNCEFICLQEVSNAQYEYLYDKLHYKYNFYTQDRGDCESLTMLYLKDIIINNFHSIWLTDTPNEKSKLENSNHIRIAEFLQFSILNYKVEIVNIHLDNSTSDVRVEEIKIIKNEMDLEYQTILAGDFNFDNTTEEYIYLMADFMDTQTTALNTMESCTYQGYGANLFSNAIDFQFIEAGDLKPYSYFVDDNTFDGIYASDHFPIVCSYAFF